MKPSNSIQLKLINPFKLVKINLLLHAYQVTRNQAKIKYKSKILLKILKAIGLFLNILMFNKLLAASSSLLKATITSTEKNCVSKEFTIRDTNSQFSSIYFRDFNNCYEPDVAACLYLFLKNGDTYIDVGANWGHHVFYAAELLGAKVVAFEPNPIVFLDIQRIATELNLEDQVKIINVGLSNAKQTLKFSQDYFESGLASGSKNFLIATKNSYLDYLKKIFKLSSITFNAEIITLDSLNLPSVELIKIDVEGLELNVLEGGFNTILRCQPAIIFECHKKTSEDYKKYDEWLEKTAYKLFHLEATLSDEVTSCYTLNFFRVDSIINLPDGQYNLLAIPNQKNIAQYIDHIRPT